MSKHSATITPKCPTPGQIDTACGAGDAHVLGCIFPMPAGQGASWNRTLVRAIASAVAAEARASGADRGFSPELQVATDPRFGRTQENFGGDPFLVSELGVAATHGLHGGNVDGPDSYLPDYNTTITSEAKHYAVYGFGDADGAPADVSIPTLYDIYLRPWKAYVEAGGRGVMASHNSVNGRPCHSSRWLLTDVLRTELGCEKCLIGTDFRDIQLLSNMNTANTSRYPGLPADTDASIQALAAGVDQDLGGYSYGSLLPAAGAKLLPPVTAQDPHGIDEAAANVLRAKFAAGLFEQPYTDAALLDAVDAAAHRELAKQAVIDGATLLQNRGGVLPRKRTELKKVAVVGPLAGCAEGAAQPCPAQQAMAGGYNPAPAAGQIVTVAQALGERLGSESLQLVLDTDSPAGISAAANASKGADLAVVVVGDSAGSCGESDDRMELDLIGHQLDLLEAVLATGTPVVTVLIHGRPATFGGDANAKWAGGSNGLLDAGDGGHAVLSIWRPGESCGPAVADIVLGVAQPGGRLAQPWPRSVGYVHSRAAPYWNLHQGDYDWGNEFPQALVKDKPWSLVDGAPWSPLFCFGHGAAYSNYSFTSMSVSGAVRSGRTDGPQKASGKLTVSVAVTDLAHFLPSSSTVVQIYAAPLSASRTGQVRYKKMLAGFTKAAIAATGTTTVAVEVSADELGGTVYEPMKAGAQNHPWVVESGEYRLLACRSECDCQLNTTVTVA